MTVNISRLIYLALFLQATLFSLLHRIQNSSECDRTMIKVVPYLPYLVTKLVFYGDLVKCLFRIHGVPGSIPISEK